MMKISDPMIFGEVVRTFLPKTFERFGSELSAAGLNANNGLGSIFDGLDGLTNGALIRSRLTTSWLRARLWQWYSERGITNLHVPSDVIVDASMPAMIRSSGHMWGPDGSEADTLAVIPDSSYAGVYQVGN